MNTYSRHAIDRSRSRGIPPLVIDWLFEFGTERHLDSREILYFDKKSRRSLRRAVGKQIVSKLDKYMNSYVVIEGGRVITAGHRFKRIRRT